MNQPGRGDLLLMRNKEVGGELGISEVTVKTHRGRVMRKMLAQSFVDAASLHGIGGRSSGIAGNKTRGGAYGKSALYRASTAFRRSEQFFIESKRLTTDYRFFSSLY